MVVRIVTAIGQLTKKPRWKVFLRIALTFYGRGTTSKPGLSKTVFAADLSAKAKVKAVKAVKVKARGKANTGKDGSRGKIKVKVRARVSKRITCSQTKVGETGMTNGIRNPHGE